MNDPLVSIIIATLNSERTLVRTLESIKRQTLSKNKFEVIVVDGGSEDRTLPIARKYKCRIILNTMVEPLSAKYLGFMKAKGRYLLGLDSDEAFRNNKSLEIRLGIFHSDKRVKSLHSSGYITPAGSAPINYYVNEFGDPFSFFIYRLTKDYRFFTETLKRRYKVVFENDDYFLVKTSPRSGRGPLMEILAAAGMVDKNFVRMKFKKLVPVKELILPHLHLHLLSVNPYIAVLKKDPLYHYSAENFKKYLYKLEWRVKNNIYFGGTIGSAGFLKREEFEGNINRAKKFFFIPYSLSLIFPLIDALWLCLTRRNTAYLIHVPLSVITSLFIIYHSLRKVLGFYPVLTSYGGSNKILKRWR
ncbi:hypothetical protein A2115_03130 [Candidatus Woesebacteria bacterium GWA1_41_8]|uniref:Glycosyltransferase 2-like domain-containing protein n=1 Tax=Candidatus Woesebacteria bacterium GWA1_41_8 TaxID=1802471 RepID=A0A1F7WJ44_9BACT|nr:MAG: hypothetical protein A2115_03130 [Candidatus Woesebacteria bacterium GWA1_41_8]